jgi:iron complex transport system substrate-binding protein
MFGVLLAAAVLTAAAAEPLRLTDGTGHVTTLARPAARIISLAPSLTEALFALGLDAEVIGVTTACDFPQSAATKPKVGTTTSASLEGLVARRPDLVLAIESLNGTVFLEQLRRLGLPVLSFTPDSVEEILSDIALIGRATGRSAAAAALIARMRGRLAAVAGRIDAAPRPSVLYMMWHDPLMTIGPDSFIADLVRRAGGRLLVEAAPLPYYRLGIETVLRRDPAVIVIPDEAGESIVAAQRRYWERWPDLAAVRNHRVHVVESDLMHRPGPRVVDGIEALARLLHPERNAAGRE